MRFLSGLLLWSMIGAAPATASEPWDAIRARAIRGHVEFLASDLLEGRAAASRGYDIAAAYLAAQFRLAGLAPGGDEGTFFQTVPLLEATPVLPGSAAELVVHDERHSFEYGTDYLPSADFAAASSTLTAGLAFVGFGITAPELQYDDLQNVDLKGRIAVVFTGAPLRFTNHHRAYYSWSVKKWSALAERGAVGAILIDSPADARRLPWERHVAMSWMPQMRWLDADGRPQDTFPEIRLLFHFNHEAASRLFDHAPVSFEQVLSTAAAGEAQGFELPGMLTLSATTGLRRTESANVLALLEGSDPKLKHEYIIVSAHLDHLGRGPAVGGDSIYNGAHDNAVGVAILLEMARTLAAAPTRPRRSVLFAALTAEEKGLLGSDFLARRARHEGRRPIAAVSIDMPLVLAPVREFVALGAQHSTLGSIAQAAAHAQGYRLSVEPRPEEVHFTRNDPFSFIRQGIPTIYLNSGSRGRDPQLDLAALQRQFLEVNYHQPSDDLTLPVDYATAADLARVNLRIVLAAANAASRPQWKPGNFFREKFATPR